MEHQMKLIGFLVISTWLIGSSYGYTFYVGGKDGWVINPRESYNHWAERNRFQVNDTLVFKFGKGMDSVLVVNQEAYNNCNKTNPKETLSDGESVFKFKRSGPFFFISGQGDKCDNGQKLIIVVMAVRNHISTMNSTTATTPASAPMMAPSSTVLQGSDGPEVYAPVAAPAMGISGGASTGHGASVGLIFGLGLGLVL